jgi:hypothetical protein
MYKTLIVDYNIVNANTNKIEKTYKDVILKDTKEETVRNVLSLKHQHSVLCFDIFNIRVNNA